MAFSADTKELTAAANRLKRTADEWTARDPRIIRAWGIIGKQAEFRAASNAAALSGGGKRFRQLSTPTAYSSSVTSRRRRRASETVLRVSIGANNAAAANSLQKQVATYAHFPHFGVGKSSKLGRLVWVYKALDQEVANATTKIKRAYENTIRRRSQLD